MTSAEREYMESRQRRLQRKQKLIAFIGVIGFGGSTLFTLVPMFKDALQRQNQPEITEVNSAEVQLKAQEKGYQSVLQREPDNLTALEGLMNVRLQLNDPKGAIEPLEKLVQLSPEREDYKALLAQLKQTINP
ncbi:tetratricopeptide repeat protein [Limnoraphis robusta]|uniref:Tetratricopeptide repeat protein n=1 Tax=Limnoraphis robusta CCNP1315 TaxID=3110306 RepID=A0ABU5TU19_9CYAN|nr:tetratricopeptide repeat protein [Limnoraphis robusta]MEA5518136.1 tetratricopeptide repeat protein [Limnoraphis robusta CCNP1315]MEA5543420.1 tetratricopeptide repeat protein [Limnoraphis robusta CCNP1324]